MLRQHPIKKSSKENQAIKIYHQDIHIQAIKSFATIYQCYITSFTCKVVKMEREPQKIVTDCTPTCCSCNPDLPTCEFGFTKNRDPDPENPEKPDHQYFINQDFHHYSIQYKIDSSMQPTYREEHTNVRRSEVTSALRRHVMATRIASRQNPGIIRRRTRNENHWQTHIENSVFLRRQSRLPTQFGKLIPEQHGPASLSHLASPQGPTAPKLKIREEDMEAMKISGDTDSEKSIDQSRRKNRTKSFHACRNVRCVECNDYSPLSYHNCSHRNLPFVRKLHTFIRIMPAYHYRSRSYLQMKLCSC